MLLIAYGTRPEWLKVKPIIEELDRKKLRYKTLFTGQHADLVETKATYNFNIDNNGFVDRLSNVLTASINGAAGILKNSFDITHVMVQGDTTSALGVALAAYHNNMKVIHLEAGLRTHDLNNPFPEEANRQLISRISSIHFCPTLANGSNLGNEWVGGEKHIVGNTSLDNLVKYGNDCDYENIVLVTLHRRENHAIIDQWFNAVDNLAKKYKDHRFILPIHPNPNVQKHRDMLKHVEVVNPLDHEDLLGILVKCKFVITDSGGIQEESSFFRKKAIVCRKQTERPEALMYTSLLCEDPEELFKMGVEIMENYEVTHNHECPFGDGKSAKKIVKILQSEKIV
jgi:UDP-N-acetylglucosamine 2-epimerase (non-hydrolysing)